MHRLCHWIIELNESARIKSIAPSYQFETSTNPTNYRETNLYQKHQFDNTIYDTALSHKQQNDLILRHVTVHNRKRHPTQSHTPTVIMDKLKPCNVADQDTVRRMLCRIQRNITRTISFNRPTGTMSSALCCCASMAFFLSEANQWGKNALDHFFIIACVRYCELAPSSAL